MYNVHCTMYILKKNKSLFKNRLRTTDRVSEGHTGKKGSFAYEKRRIIDEFTRTIAVELLQNQTIDFTSYLHGCMKYLSLQPGTDKI